MTLGYHVVKSGYGLWLPGDSRGHWSSPWDDQIGYIEPGVLHQGDPVRERMARERMAHPPMRLSARMVQIVRDKFTECAANSPWNICAMSVEETHSHLLIPYSGLDIYKTAKWLTDQTTKAIHRSTDYSGPVWCKGSWISFISEESYWANVREYIDRHNERRAAKARG